MRKIIEAVSNTSQKQYMKRVKSLKSIKAELDTVLSNKLKFLESAVDFDDYKSHEGLDDIIIDMDNLVGKIKNL